MPAVFEIDENTHRLLLTACGMSEFDEQERLRPVPEPVANSYVEFLRCFNRLSGRICATETIALIAAMHGYGAIVSHLDGGKWDAGEEWKAKRLKYDDWVLVADDNGRERQARMKQLSGRGSAMVQFKGDSGETKVGVRNIRPIREPVRA
jgi:hypothetical protein